MDRLINSLEKINKMIAENESLNAIEIDLLKKYTLAFYEELSIDNLPKKIEKIIVEPEIENFVPKAEVPMVENTFKTEQIVPKVEEKHTEIPETENPVVQTIPSIIEEKVEVWVAPIIEKPTVIEPEIMVPKVEIIAENKAENSVEAERTVAIEEEIKKAELQNNTPKPVVKNVFNKVDDIRKAISIQKKFEYIKSLFANDLEEYNKSILQLNNMSNIDVAISYFNELKVKQNWQDDNQLVIELLELVNRRYS